MRMTYVSAEKEILGIEMVFRVMIQMSKGGRKRGTEGTTLNDDEGERE